MRRSSRGSQQAAPASFRVVSRHRNGSRGLVTLAETGRQAQSLARHHLGQLLTSGACSAQLPAALVIEEWIGTLTEGRWKQVAAIICRHAARSERPPSSGPRPGDAVAAELVKRTRRGGWQARMLRGPTGPVTNSEDVPSHFAIGQSVSLVVEALGRGHVQFRWTGGTNAAAFPPPPTAP